MINREIIGRRLIYFAWGVEIVAASIGLVIAALVILATHQRIADSGSELPALGYMEMFLGGLPFIVVAMVELTKIPLATACYTAVNRWWKTAFGVALIVLSIITFETILNGFERNFTQRTYVISTIKKQVTMFDERIAKTELDKDGLSKITDAKIRETYLADIKQMDKEKDAEVSEIENQRNQARSRYGGEEVEVKRQRLQEVVEELERLKQREKEERAKIDQRDKERIERIDQSVADNRKSLNDQLEQLEQKLAEFRRQENQRLATVSGTSTAMAEEIARIEKNFHNRISRHRNEVAEKRQDLDQRIAAQRENIRATEAGRAKNLSETDRDGIQERNEKRENAEIARIEKNFHDRISSHRNEIAEARRDLDQRLAAQGDEIHAIEKEREKELSRTIFFLRAGVLTSYEKTLSPMRDRLGNLVEERKALSVEQKIDDLSREMERQISQARERFAEQGLKAERERERMRDRLGKVEEERKALSAEQKIDDLSREMERQIAQARERFAEQGSKAERERENIRNEFAVKRKPDEQLLQASRQEKNSLSTDSQRERATIKREQELDALTQKLEVRRSEIHAAQARLTEEISTIVNLKRLSLEPVLQRLAEKEISVIERFKSRRQDRLARRETDMGQLDDRNAEIRRMEVELKRLREERIRGRDEIAKEARSSQIHRTAALAYGKDSPADITNRELRMVTIIWFGSLAAITAWTGTILAFGGLVIMYGPKERSRRLPPVRRAVRALLVDWRRRVRRPVVKVVEKEVVKTVEVVREVPVDKVVFQDVPKEIVHKELVYVPMFTDDPDLLRQPIAGRDSDATAPADPPADSATPDDADAPDDAAKGG